MSQHNAKEYLVTYSIKISGGSDGTDGSPPQEEVRGVMVIKSNDRLNVSFQTMCNAECVFQKVKIRRELDNVKELLATGR